ITACLGVSEEIFSKALLQFQRPKHRIEWVAEIDLVTYYNDSKASNVDAVVHAVSLCSGPIVLIAGGVDKGAPYQPWIDTFGKKVKGIVVFGMAAEKMVRELKETFFIQQVLHLKDAVQVARQLASKGDTILFSPGCSSYDQFANYEERGEAFRKIVQEG
ncbi:MAG: UDP-N-acetylmuramoyl-L-alanine--D-glutamate ligase, partial [Chlamydiia bacterium]|nr:UDP-N-acetylmuramoyl-L-alanine--D-glutamate ligase [Chlamydiia bacterium]